MTRRKITYTAEITALGISIFVMWKYVDFYNLEVLDYWIIALSILQVILLIISYAMSKYRR